MRLKKKCVGTWKGRVYFSWSRFHYRGVLRVFFSGVFMGFANGWASMSLIAVYRFTKESITRSMRPPFSPLLPQFPVLHLSHGTKKEWVGGRSSPHENHWSIANQTLSLFVQLSVPRFEDSFAAHFVPITTSIIIGTLEYIEYMSEQLDSFKNK